MPRNNSDIKRKEINLFQQKALKTEQIFYQK